MFNTIKHIKLLLLLVSLLMSTSSFSQYDTSFIEKKDSAKMFDKVNLFQIRQVQERKVRDTVVQNLKKDDAFWYVDLKPEREKKQQRFPSSIKLRNLSWLQPLIWTLIIGGFTAVLIWYLAISNITLFRKAAKKMEPVVAEGVTEDIFSLDYEAEIHKAVSEQNFRLAVRLLFLQTLKKLSQKSIIQYQTSRTNSDYLLQLFNTSYYKDFFKLTRNFEYTWYGQMPLQEPSFAVMKNDFETFNQRLSY